MPMWTVNILVRQSNALRTELMSENFPSTKDPNELFAGFDQIAFVRWLTMMRGGSESERIFLLAWVQFGLPCDFDIVLRYARSSNVATSL